ncbi:MAG: hypothetical protein KTR17_11035 [Cellvibrionaceae bacterium]|nr:hypothetical protein [Cellvibrionaceae bacterium]
MKAFLTRYTYNTALLSSTLQEVGIELECREDDSICPQELVAKKMAEVDALLTHTEDDISASMLASAGSNLKVIANMGIGFSNIDTAAAKAKNIVVTNTPTEEAFEATAEATVAMLLAVARRIPALHVERRGMDQDPSPSFLRPTATSVRNKTTGIVGMGRIGSRVAKTMASGFNNQILYFDKYVKQDLEAEIGAKKVDLKTLMNESDFICVNAPLNEHTHGLVSAEMISAIKPHATFINTARGGVIDEVALVKRLNEGTLHGAGLDVYSAAVNNITADNIALTSHFANFEDEAYTAMTMLVAKNVIAVLTNNAAVSPVS